MEDLEELNIKMNTTQLLATQRDLKQEKDLLLKILAKIDNQVHRLQVNTFIICLSHVSEQFLL